MSNEYDFTEEQVEKFKKACCWTPEDDRKWRLTMEKKKCSNG